MHVEGAARGFSMLDLIYGHNKVLAHDSNSAAKNFSNHSLPLVIDLTASIVRCAFGSGSFYYCFKRFCIWLELQFIPRVGSLDQDYLD